MNLQCLFSALSLAVRKSVRAVFALFLILLFVQISVGATGELQGASAKKSKAKSGGRRPHASGPALTPANPAVTPGSAITLTSSSAVTWTLSGVGALSNQTPTSVTYTAPASVVAQHQMLGCPVLPNDTVFNTRIDNLPLDPNSSNMIAAQSAVVPLSFEPSWGISYADNTTPTRTMITYYGQVNTPNFVFPLQGPSMKRESGDYVGTFQFKAAPDHHVMTVRRTDCTFWESYDDYLNGYTRTCQDGVTQNCNVQSDVNYNSATYNYPVGGWGTDAGGFLLAPLLWHVDEIKSGTINHAVRFTEGLTGILFNGIRWPATNTAGGCSVCPNAFPMGTRVRLKASFNISTFSATAQVMLTALQHYGMILVDTGSNNAITTSIDLLDDPTVAAALNELRAAAINISNFEVVDESSLQFAANSYTVCPYNTACQAATNSYEQPASQAMITATTSNGTATSLPIALQPISIGLKVPSVLPVQAGNYSFTIPYWVNNTSNQTVNWTLQSGAGSVTTAGVYTPPTSTTNSGTTTKTVLMGVSAADPNISTYLYINVLPAGSNPVGSIRIDSGAGTNNNDQNGNVWLADIGLEGAGTLVPGDYPNWVTANPDRLIFQSAAISYGNDLRYTMVVPNGNYKVHYLLGVPYNGCPSPCGYYAGYYGQDIHTYNPQMLETQGIIQNHYFDFGAPYSYAFAQPVDVYAPAIVSNNILEVGILALAPDVGPNLTPAGSNKFNILNGVEILPDASAPRWTIDTQQQTTIAPGQSLRPFYVTDWYTGVNDPTWTVVSGPPGLSFNGSTLTLAAGSYLNGQPIVVKATDGTYSATAALYTAGGTNALGVYVPPPAANHFGYKRAVTINHAHVNAPQTNFPVLVSITDPALETIANGGHVQQANGYDIVLTSDAAGQNRLNWEVEKYDPVAGNWIAHVNIPTLSNTADTIIYAFYGNPAITTDQSSAAAVWDSNFNAVYHFASITTASTPDSTANKNNALSNDAVTITAGGEIGSGGAFVQGSGAHFVLPAAVLNSASGTLSAWINPTEASAAGNTYGTGSQSDSNKEFRFAEWSSYNGGTLFGWNSGSSDYTLNVPTSSFIMPANAWSHVVYTWNQAANTQVIYLNGTAAKTVSSAFFPYTPVNGFWLGTDAQNPSYNLAGTLDEVRFSTIARAAGWIATEYANQSSPATFITLGSENPN